MSLLEVKNLKKSFDENVVLKDISLNVEKGEVLCIIGPSGSGKSTLLRCITDLEQEDSGDINFGFGSWLDDETLNNTKIEENGQTNQIGCKFGLYTCEGGDKIIRFKNFKALEYNPKNAFNIINPY